MRLALVLLLVTTAACGASIGGDPALATDPSATDAGATTDAATTDASGIDAASSPPLDAPATTALTGTSMLLSVYTQICTEAFSCEADYPGSDHSFHSHWDNSIPDCVRDLDDTDGASHVDGDIANGKITFSPAAATTCVATLTFGTCAQFFADPYATPAACTTALVGSVAHLGACNAAYECADPTEICAFSRCLDD